MIDMNQNLYGERDMSYTVLGIEFSAEGPMIYYPQGGGKIIIQLSLSAATYPNRAYYQLAHESVHLLSPSGGRNANNLEEGLAVRFSNIYLQYIGLAPMRCIDPKYSTAADAVEALMKPDLDVIKKIRKDEPRMYKITKDLLKKHAPHLTDEQADFLTTKFSS